MLQAKVQEVFNEPGCATNRGKTEKQRKAGCAKQLTPGAAAGGCAFDGAKIALQPITDCIHLVHGPIACEGNGWDNRHAKSSGPETYRIGATTDMSDLDVVYGGEKKLYRAIKEAIARFDPPAVFVYQTCVPAMIGDDIVKVCEVASQKLGKPVIPVNAPGFVGKKNLGNKLGGEALLDYVIGTEEPAVTTPCDINIIGDYNIAGELWQVEPLLTELGIRVLGRITGNARYHDVTVAHRARISMIVCSQALINVARKLEERYGIPYFEGSFYGITDTSQALRTIARMLVERGAPPDLLERTEALIGREEAKVETRLAAYRRRLEGRKVLLYTGGHKSWSVISALGDVGIRVIGTSVRKSTADDKERARDLMGEDGKLYEALPQSEMYRMLKEGEADMMLSGGRTQFIALKAKTPWLDMNQERHQAYAGYVGMLALVEEIDRALANPVWEQLRLPAPWDDMEGEG
ncbi:nitrogenase iron-molybdenum cofactor biosynthesis protein NifE [Telmatospirillum siberiense]|uniref:Nitrogenase iron-molybdenum cofactor biosynthesis protein NifE n=1 Tax=Telmatospirillum siberiense TaxID=382514 RepID=A0A2N3PNI2_9PROT|nr:nitrogenase iron-molybdenum cofactor biosynthesis protein NifE [Telmatospirillum siberiense]PKU21940.1 nitrogenase iron-molybdenum cofactor biosynthesis protein NifE [Telmatospirillum siberiense]